MDLLSKTLDNKDLTDDDILNLVSDFDFDDLQITDEINSIDTIDDTCINCGEKDKLRNDSQQGYIVCTNCGTVYDNIVDSSPEWKNYGGDDERRDVGRCSMPINPHLPQSSLGTSIPYRCKIQTLHRWSQMPYKERSRYIVLKQIEDVCHKANIIKCIEDDAKIIFNNVSECKHIKGKNKGKNIIIRGINRLGLIAACVYFACRRNNKPINPKEISFFFNIRQKDLTKGRRTLFKLIKIRKMGFDLKSSTAEDFIPGMCNKLRIEDKLLKQVITLAKNIRILNIASAHTQPSIATACMLLMIQINNLTITKKLIASTFDVSEVTITKAFRCIEEYKSIIIDEEKTKQVAKMFEEERKKLEMPKSLQDKYKTLGLDQDSDSDSDDSFSDENYEEEDIIDTKTLCDIEYDDVTLYCSDIDISLYNLLGLTENKYNILLGEISN